MKHSIARSLFILILLISLLTIGITTAMSVYEANVFVRETVVSRASNAAQVIAVLYDGVLPDTVLADEQVGTVMSQTFEILIRSFQLEYLYIMIPDTDSGQITYVCVEGNEENRESAWSLPPGTIRKRDISPELAAVMHGDTKHITRETDNQYGHVFSAYVPLLDDDGLVTAVVGADIRADDLSSRFERVLIWKVVFFLGLVIVVSFVLYHVLKKKVIKPAETISASMRAFGEDDNYDVKPLQIQGDNEFSHIGMAFNHMAANTRDYIARIKAYTELQNRQEYEFRVASEIQQGFLPEPQHADEYSEIRALMLPARNVGGDFYDYFADRGHMVLVVADVSGKGLSGAIFMASVITLIRGFVKQGLTPGEVLEAVNAELEHSNPNMMFITVFLAFADPKAGVFRYANAGHNPPYLLHEGKFAPLSSAGGVPLGLFSDERYQTAELVLPLDSTFFLYTDGVSEAVDLNAKFFGLERLERILAETDGANTVLQVKNELEHFTAGSEQSDDITMLSFTSLSARLTLPAELSALGSLHNWIRTDDRIPEEIKKRLCLIAEECFVNICSYAYEPPGGTVICHKQSWADGTVAMQFTDSGRPFDQTKDTIRAEDYNPDEQIGGLGRLIFQSLADCCRYVNLDGNNVLLIIMYAKEEHR
ncbi:MAG: SpoIIE family protein phosphatase [Bacillota bacterium]|nr:SpoIIE family protein phosphatase [Bacillota bacterium]